MDAQARRTREATAIVLGCDTTGSAVAHALHRAGWAVVLVDDIDPSAPYRGVVVTRCRIGDSVAPGAIVGDVNGIQLVAPVAGVLLGLSARGARVDAGAIVAEVDPRDVAENCYGLDERGVRVSEGVLASLEVRALSRGASPGRPHGIDVVRHA